jgi:hypothetical protein
MHEGDYIDWEVYMYGGSSKTSVVEDDPISIDDRGLWFDGAHHFLSVTGLTLHHTFSLSGWIKPHGAGIIFNAASDGNSTESGDFALERSLYWSVAEYSVNWADTFHHSFTQFNAVSMYEWQHSCLMIIWEQESG